MGISQKGQKRYDCFLQTGLELFLKYGYERTSLNDIVNKSGGSLASIYKFFHNKEGLFAAILEQKFEIFQKELDKNIILNKNENIQDFLYKFGITYFDIFYKIDTIMFSRIIISENYKNKNIGKLFFDCIIARTTNVLAEYFQTQVTQKSIKELNAFDGIDKYSKSEFLACKFLALIREPFYTHSLLLGENHLKNINKKKKEAIIENVVELFLHGILK